eukprot:TRINITY_DN2244_c0_g3_i1.p2 TRINITY_DN2244_c0_g3~~TRINITY_DN2244_c0_g3_i1.p2  ORF type:complete len:105 (-),score=9.62 TRINITY_DN2244_c0_g3_i1:95-409(-)
MKARKKRVRDTEEEEEEEREREREWVCVCAVCAVCAVRVRRLCLRISNKPAHPLYNCKTKTDGKTGETNRNIKYIKKRPFVICCVLLFGNSAGETVALSSTTRK